MMKRDLKGFTLPELMVVVLIMAILLAVVVPTYINARNRAIARAAQSRLRNVVIATKSLYVDSDKKYNQQTAADLTSEAQPIQVIAADGDATPDENTTSVMITASTADTITFKTRDANNNIRTGSIAATGAVTID